MFGSLFFAYGILRAHSPMWPPPGAPPIPRGLPAVGTVVLGLSSYLLQLGTRRLAQKREAKRVALAIGGAAALGFAFLCLQAVVWHGLWLDGLVPRTGGYGAVFYLLTAFHAAHVVVGLVALSWLARGVTVGRYHAARQMPLRLWTMYWHFVSAVWLLMFATVYLM